MRETSEQVLSRIRTGEGGTTAFAEIRLDERGVVAPSREEAAAELVALANACGGLLLLGVDEAGGVVGVPEERSAEAQRWVAEVAANDCDPPVRPTIRAERLRESGEDGEEWRRVLVVEVPRGIFVHRTSGGRCYARAGPTTSRLSTDELAWLFRERERRFVFDRQVVFDASVEALDRKRLEAFFGRAPKLPWFDLLRNTGVTGRDGDGADRPTVAGLLCFGRDPTDFLPFAFIEAACYGGVESSSRQPVHEERLAGRVADQIDAATAFVARFMARGDGAEVGAAPYDLDVVAEAVVNAVAHRDYSIHGAKIRLFLYADRLEIHSPGKPPNDLTVEQLPYRTFTRNQLLVGFLRKLHSRRTGRVFMEWRREGVTTILNRGEAHSGRRPEYQLSGNELRLTIRPRRP